MTQGMETGQYIGTGLVLVCEKEWCICCFESVVLSERRGKTQPDNVAKCVDAIMSRFLRKGICIHAINNVIRQVELDVLFSYAHTFFLEWISIEQMPSKNGQQSKADFMKRIVISFVYKTPEVFDHPTLLRIFVHLILTALIIFHRLDLLEVQ
jgi:hypothetical protein